MSITVYLQDDQDIDQALHLLNQKHYYLQATRWYKKRYGYFEKPSVLKRKRKKMKQFKL
jgi:ribosomal protein S21